MPEPVRAMIAFAAAYAACVGIAAAVASSGPPAPVELAPGEPIRIALTSTPEGLVVTEPDGERDRIVELPVNRELDVVLRRGTPRTVHIAGLGLTARARADRDVHLRWIVPRRFRATRHLVTCTPVCSPAVVVHVRHEALFDPPGCVAMPCGLGATPPCEWEGDPLVCWGRYLHGQAGCVSCHASSPEVNEPGPSWAGSWGTSRALEDGRVVVVDEDYVRRAILTPHVDVARGYTTTIMNPYRFSDRQIAAITAYIASLALRPPLR